MNDRPSPLLVSADRQRGDRLGTDPPNRPRAPILCDVPGSGDSRHAAIPRRTQEAAS